MKKLLSMLLSVLMIVTCVSFNTGVLVYADDSEADLTPSTTYSEDEYTFEKISHPDKGTKTADGIVDYVGDGVDAAKDQGQGDRGQNYSWSAVSYGDWIYVGTCYSSMGSTLTLMGSALGDSFDKDIMNAIEDSLYNGTFFNGQEDGKDSNGILVKINVKTGEVKLLMSKATTGQNVMFRNAVEYKDKLYFCGSVNSLPSIYQIDPENDDEIKLVHQGMTMQQYYQTYMQKICSGIRGLCVYTDKNGNEKLVVSCVGVDGPYIMISDDGTNFTNIATQADLFNYPAYHYYDSIYGGSIWEMVEYNDSLYVSICTGTPENMPDDYTMQSFALVRGDEQEDGSFKWTSVIGDQENDGAKYTFGIDPERTRSGAGVLKVYGDYLYIGEYNDEEIALENILFDPETSTCPGLDFEFINRNLEQSVSLYRMDKNEDIELIVGDATEMFPDGGTSGIGSGFGHNENQYIWRMEEYDGKLYVGTFDTSSLLECVGQFSNGDLLNMSCEEWQSQINYNKVLFTLIAEKYQSQEEDSSLTEVEADADQNGEQPEYEQPEYEQPETEEEAYTLIEQAIAVCNSDSEAELADVEDSQENKVCLTDEQKQELVAELLNGSIEVGILDEDTSNAVKTLLLELEDLGTLLDSEDKEAFTNEYETICDQFSTIVEKIRKCNEAAAEALEKIFNENTLKKMKSLVTCLAYMSKAERGFDLYVTEDGVNFKTITTDGFGDPYNHGLRVFATTDDYLAIGTANPFFGTQIWRLAKGKTTDISNCTVDSIMDQTYTGSVIEPKVTVKDDENTLTSGTDYTVEYSNNTDVGEATVTITGMGNYTGTKTVNFTIKGKQLTVSGTTVAGKTYDGTTNAAVTMGTVSGIVSGDNVTVTVSGAFDNANAGENKTVAVTYSISGADVANYIAPATDTSLRSTIVPVALTDVTLDKTSFVSNGKAQGPAVTVYFNGVKLTEGTDYILTGATATAEGNYTLTVTGKGNYTGTVQRGYAITAAASSGSTDNSKTDYIVCPACGYHNWTFVEGKGYVCDHCGRVRSVTTTTTTVKTSGRANPQTGIWN